MIITKQLEVSTLDDWMESKDYSAMDEELAYEMDTNKEEVLVCIDYLEKLGYIDKKYSIARSRIVVGKGKEIMKQWCKGTPATISGRYT